MADLLHERDSDVSLDDLVQEIKDGLHDDEMIDLSGYFNDPMPRAFTSGLSSPIFPSLRSLSLSPAKSEDKFSLIDLPKSKGYCKLQLCNNVLQKAFYKEQGFAFEKGSLWGTSPVVSASNEFVSISLCSSLILY